MLFIRRQNRRFSVNGGGTGEHHALHFRVARRHQNVQRPVHINAIRFAGVDHRSRHGRPRGQVNHEIHSAARLTQPVQIRDAVLHKFDFRFHPSQIRRLSGRQIIQHHHVVTAAHQFVHVFEPMNPAPPVTR